VLRALPRDLIVMEKHRANLPAAPRSAVFDDFIHVVHYWPGEMLFSLYRFDSTILVALYTHRRGRQDVPMLVSSKGGSLYEFFASELEEISQRSKPATGS
jgi:hypothetical protein